jgi:beta-glucosidase
MPSGSFHFPRGFLWGTATAAHQVEGNNTNNNWYKWEQEGHTAGRSGLACDWWGGRWKEDFDRAAEAGQNAHRLSVEWSRIQPAPDRWDEDALDRYRLMLRGLHDRGMTPMVTLHHFTDPLWLGEMGGWETAAVVPLFEKFTRKVVEALKEYCSLWCTINEPNVYTVGGYLSDTFPPGIKKVRLAMDVQANLVRGHAAAYQAIHAVQPEARVGYAWHFRPMLPAHAWSPLDRLVRNIAYNGLNLSFPSAISTGIMRTPFGKVRLPEVKRTQDYLGINYYSVDTVAFDLRKPGDLFIHRYYPKGTDLSDSGFNANQPQGMFDTLKWAVRLYPRLPLIVTENGIECADDHIRPRYLAQHVHQVWRAVNFNWPVKGYFHWSQVDNFEWALRLMGTQCGDPGAHPPPICGPLRRHLQGERDLLCDGGEVLPRGVRETLPRLIFG